MPETPTSAQKRAMDYVRATCPDLTDDWAVVAASIDYLIAEVDARSGEIAELRAEVETLRYDLAALRTQHAELVRATAQGLDLAHQKQREYTDAKVAEQEPK